MSKETKNKIVPKLRFKEFKDGGEWEEKKLGSICSNIASGKDKIDVSGEFDLYGSTGVIGKTNDYTYDGNLILVARVGANAGLLTRPNGKFGVTDNTLVVSLYDSENIDFIYNTLEEFGLNKLVFGSGQPLITGGQLKSLIINLPKSEEQQKIAACLSSLDELITAQNQKLEAIKAHKKGLMQQLFPADGETVPKLRFKEFRDCGEWEERTLEQISSAIFDGTHQTPKYTEEGIPFFSVENIISGNKNKFISREDYLIATIKNKPKKGDILITRIGNIGFSKIVDWNYEFSIYVTLAVVKKSKQFDSYYLHSFFQTDYYQNELRSKSLLNAVPCKINMNELRKSKVLLPNNMKEQQKIASCLSSLDELITAQTEKIEALKEHKKGLMQGLFSVSEP